MRILLAASASYIPPRGGATRSNLAWLERMAARGHECRVVSAALPGETESARQLYEEAISTRPAGDGAAECAGVVVYAARDPHHRCALLARQVREFHPDWVLVSSEDLGHVLLREAARSASGRLVYLAHTPQFYPFGPESWNPDPAAAALVAGAAAVVAISGSMAAYIERHTGRPAAVAHPPIYGTGPFPNLACFDRGRVGMINPCAIKGVEIFAALARRFPALGFGAVTGWGTTQADRQLLAAQPNITLLPNVPDIEQFLAGTRVLLMPSLWLEGFGLIVTEAMLRGIPVVASDSGGLVEAKMGTRFLIPTPRLARYKPVYDERNLPRPVLPHVDVEPWAAALHALTTDRALYESESRAAREAALRFVTGIDRDALEKLLANLEPSAAATGPAASLSSAKRELLLRRLKQKAR